MDKTEVKKKLGNNEQRYLEMRSRELDISRIVYDIKYCLRMFHEFTENNSDYLIYEVCSGGDLNGK